MDDTTDYVNTQLTVKRTQLTIMRHSRLLLDAADLFLTTHIQVRQTANCQKTQLTVDKTADWLKTQIFV